MAKTLGELAEMVGGRLEGDPEREVCGVATLAAAGPGDVAFVANGRHRAAAAHSRAACLIVAEDFDGIPAGAARLIVDDPNRAMARVTEALLAPLPVLPPGVHPTASVDASATLGEAIHVGACAVVGPGATVGRGSRIRAGAIVADEAVLGAECDVHSGVVIRERCRLGDRVVVHAGSVLGADGFGYLEGPAGPEKIPQLGTVEIGDDVEIGACVTVDRARFGATRIGPRTKIDNLVQIGHNVEIGEACVLVAQVAIAGSTRLGPGCMVGGQAAIDGHLEIGPGARIAAKAGVTKDVPVGADVSGYPAVAHRMHLKQEAALRRMGEVLGRLETLERRLAALEAGDHA